MRFLQEYQGTWVEPSPLEASLLRRWNLYLVSIEIFNRSLPHHPSPYGSDRVWPDMSWGAAGTGYALQLRDWLDLGDGGPPVGVGSHLSHTARLDLVVREWVRAAYEAETGHFDRLRDFGINWLKIENHAEGKRCTFARFGHRHPHTMPFAQALGEMWTGHSDGCSHALKIERDYSGCPRIGICLRCGCRCDPPSRREGPLSFWVEGDVVANRSSGLERAAVIAESRAVSWPTYAYLPGSKDSWPLGQAPGEREAFAQALSAMRRSAS